MPAAATSATGTSAVSETATSAPGTGPTTRAGATGRPRAGRERRRVAQLVAVVLALLLGVAGCSAGGATGSAASDEAVAGPEAGPGGEAGGDADAPQEASAAEDGSGAGGSAGGGDGTGEATTGVLAAGDGGRRVVTSSIDVAVEDVAAAAEQVRALATRVDGEVAQESTRGGERPRAEIVLRVPVDEAAAVLTAVAALGEEVTRTAEAEPVEARLVDLTSRTATQRAGVERIRSLLGQAGTLEDVLALEQELTRRQADLESVDAQRAALADLAALATVTVRLSTPDDVALPPAELPPFLQGLEAGWEALAASTAVVLVLLGGLLPFAVVGSVVLAAVLLTLRLVRRDRSEAGSPS